jgi:putative ABC transport system permease protein
MQDLRHTLKTLRQSAGFTALAVLTLGVGLALCITVLSVANAYVIRGLPYPAADRLYRVDYAARGQNPPRGLEALDWASLADIVETPVAWDLDVFYLLGKGVTEPTPGAWVTPGYLPALGLRTTLGRLFTPEDYRSGAAAVALISHRLWQTRFGGDPNVLGQRLQAYVSDRPDEPEALTIVGVLPADLWHFNAYTEVIAPLRDVSYPYLVRLRTNVPVAIAVERMSALVRAGLPAAPRDFAVTLTSQQAAYTETVRPMLWAVAVSAGLILLIAGANVAVLMLIRGRHREKELAVRLALGATHRGLARLLALEGAVIGAAATIAAIGAAAAALRLMGPSFERFLERRVPGGLEALSVDGTVLAGAILCGVVITTLATLAPLVALRASSLQSTLTLLSRAATDAPRAGRARTLLIGVEIAASLTLLSGAALMAQTAFRMLRVDFGVNADQAVTASLSLRQRSYPAPADRAAFYDRLIAQLDDVAGNSGAALGDWWPLQGSRPRQVETGGAPRTIGSASIFAVSAGYFDTLGMTLREGRDFDARDRIGGEPVVVVSESLAQRLWPRAPAVGQRLSIRPDEPGDVQEHLVIGVVNDVRQTHADTDTSDAYLSLAQRAGRFAFLYLRQPRSPTWENEIREAVAAVDAEVALGAPRSLGLGIEQERAKPRFLAFLLAVFAGLACVMALVGVHGVIAYAVRQRRREIAIRMAIGASGRAVTRLFVRQGARVLAAGLLSGIAGALALGRVLRSQLFGVEPGDPWILSTAVAAFAATALAAIWWPAARSAATDPALVLKES